MFVELRETNRLIPLPSRRNRTAVGRAFARCNAITPGGTLAVSRWDSSVLESLRAGRRPSPPPSCRASSFQIPRSYSPSVGPRPSSP